MTSFEKRSYEAHSAGKKFNEQDILNLKDTESHDHWRHTRMHDTLLPILNNYKNNQWLTIGDGNFGRDAHYLIENGAQAMATDLNNPSFELAKASGYITDFKIENAEKLSFADESFDFTFCKESFHHFPRPYMALYEMIRVARKAIIILEPHDQDTTTLASMKLKNSFFWMLRTVLRKIKGKNTIDYTNAYETVGNFIFNLNLHELRKSAAALNLDSLAYLFFNDHFLEEGLPPENYIQNLNRVKSGIAAKDRKVKFGISFSGMITAIIFKEAPTKECHAALHEAGYIFEKLPRNPYLK